MGTFQWAATLSTVLSPFWKGVNFKYNICSPSTNLLLRGQLFSLFKKTRFQKEVGMHRKTNRKSQKVPPYQIWLILPLNMMHKEANMSLCNMQTRKVQMSGRNPAVRLDHSSTYTTVAIDSPRRMIRVCFVCKLHKNPITKTRLYNFDPLKPTFI